MEEVRTDGVEIGTEGAAEVRTERAREARIEGVEEARKEQVAEEGMEETVEAQDMEDKIQEQYQFYRQRDRQNNGISKSRT